MTGGKNLKACVIMSIFLLGMVCTAAGKIIYVDADANGLNDGSSWTDAYNDLQDALAAAQYGDGIRVAQGIYKPDQGAGIMPGERYATFQLINGVTIKGGYAGFSEPDPNAWDIEQYETILSGDLNGNDVDVNDPCDLLTEPTRTENSIHVMVSSGTDSTAVLDGFTITAGNYNVHGTIPSGGGGMYNNSGTPTLINCTFHYNSAGDGGGMYNAYSSPALVNCTFGHNSASGAGGGMCSGSSSPTLINCTFNNNSAGGGGGMSNSYNSYPTLTNCTFNNNSAGDYGGGGMYNYWCNPILTNCIFVRNSANNMGGAIYITRTSSVTLTNCTFVANSATLGNAVACDGTGSWGPAWSNLQISNCILWDGGNEIWDGGNSDVTIDYSDIPGGWPGEGNIDTDPCFVDLGSWVNKNDPNIVVEPNDPNAVWVYGDYHLLADSPCIDAGDPNYVPEPNETDLDGKPRIIGGRIDMGAYEYSPTIPAEARIVPRTINLASKGKWIGCYIWLPEEYNVADIDPNSILLEDEIQPDRFSVDEQEQVALARFIREQAQAILEAGQAELKITGQLTDETIFEGRDVIRVIDRDGGKSVK